jgi:hypothetical protein
VFHWSHNRAEKRTSHELGRQLHRHIRTTHVIIYRWSESINAFNASLKSLRELKWCTHLSWCVLDRLDLSPVSGMTSLQHLDINLLTHLRDEYKPKLPLDCLPNLTTLTINRMDLADLKKIPNPPLLQHLAIWDMYDWNLEDDDIRRFTHLLQFNSLRTLRLGHNDKQFYNISRLDMIALMSSLTQLQRLSIESIESLSPMEMKKSPSTWFGTIPPTLNDIRYFQPDPDLTPLLAFPSLTKLELTWPASHWDDFIKLAPKLVSLTFPHVDFSEAALTTIGKCTRLTSLIIDGGRAFDGFNLTQWRALPLKKLTWDNVQIYGTCNHNHFI